VFEGKRTESMRRIAVSLGVMVAVLVFSASAQLRTENQNDVTQSMVRPAQSISSFLGLLNPDNFMMRHSISLSYLSLGGAGMSVASYTNSMFYKISDPLNVRVDLTLQGSPFGSSSGFSPGELNKLFISNAELNYHPSNNMSIKLQYNQLPLGLYDGYYPYALSPFLRDQ
jgi:hypothetical protein